MRLVWITVIFLAVIGIAAVVDRALALYSPARVSDSNNPATQWTPGSSGILA